MRLAQIAFLVLVIFWPVGQPELCAQAPPASIPIGKELLSNGNFAAATKDPTWPDDWKRRAWLSWQTGKDGRYLEFVANEPGQTLELSRDIPLSIEEGVKALEIVVRYRTRNLKAGPKGGNDGRLKLTYYDTIRIKYTPAPEPIVFSTHADNWAVATTKVRVPDHAVNLAISVGLFQVQSGTLDLAEVSIKNIPEADVPQPTVSNAVEPASKTGAPVPIRREGGHTIFGDGKPSIWLIHPYVDVLGHDFDEGISHLVSQARDEGISIAIGVAGSLDEINQQDEANTIYVFSYKNINYPLPASARQLVFLNTWLTPSVAWPDLRKGKTDVVLLGSRTLHNDGDGKEIDKDRWFQIQKDDPSLTLTVLDSTGYYLPMSVWREALLKIIREDRAK